MLGHVFGNRRLPNINAELEEFAMDARRKPMSADYPIYWRHSGQEWPCRLSQSVEIDPNVWSGRALQANFIELADVWPTKSIASLSHSP